ncbi:MAG: T9SS type A sorting domain-containing protein, partial [Fulvivirga sp.]|uniref:T9SS type A sorting domain-containing protein n=1 Tax=Fulvivirga sp. TaxID=1931237 RepID=UPI0032EB9A72
DKTLGDDPFTLSATASSGLDVSFFSNSNRVDISSAGEVTLLEAGSVTIDANQAGDATFAPAPTVSRTFCINPMKPVITVNNDNSESVQLSSSSSAGNQWFLNGEAIPSATGATLDVDSEGIYTVQVTVDGCTSAVSDDVALIVTSTGLSNRLDAVSVFPNPATNLIQIKGFAGDVSGLQLFDLSGRAQQTTFRVNGNVIESDISAIPNGVYLLMINSKESTQQIRIVKN